MGRVTAPAAPLVQVEGLTVHYGDRRALDDVDLIVEPGSTVAIIGPNGSGKSTLLGVLASLVTPTRGTVRVERSRVAIVLQTTAIDPSLPITVAETVRMARYRERGLFGRFRGDDRTAVDEALHRMQVADLAGRRLHDLSGGQRQRVLVAQGLAQGSDLLLLDEPVNGLDVVSRDVILGVIDEERDAGRCVVLTTHSLEEAGRCNEVVLLAGRVIAAGTPAEVITSDHLDRAFHSDVARLPTGQLFLDQTHHHEPHHGR